MEAFQLVFNTVLELQEDVFRGFLKRYNFIRYNFSRYNFSSIQCSIDIYKELECEIDIYTLTTHQVFGQILGQILTRFLTRVFGIRKYSVQVYWDRKYSVQVYWDRKYSVQFYWDRKSLPANYSSFFRPNRKTGYPLTTNNIAIL